MRKKMHPADIAAREQIAKADRFSVFQQRFSGRVAEHDFGSLERAAARAKQLEAEFSKRPALIYAVVDGNSVPVPNDMRNAAQDGAEVAPDRVIELQDGFYARVGGKLYGAWVTRPMAEAGLKVEQERADKRNRKERS